METSLYDVAKVLVEAYRDPRGNPVMNRPSSSSLKKWYNVMGEGFEVKDLKRVHSFGTPGSLYNGLYAIQLNLLDNKLPPLRKDLNRAKDILFSMRTGSSDLDETKFLRWYDVRTEVGQLREPSLLGDIVRNSSKPSILFGARLHD